VRLRVSLRSGKEEVGDSRLPSTGLIEDNCNFSCSMMGSGEIEEMC